MQEDGTPGLRERKKARTREAIVEAAVRLFLAKGFDETTIEEIAAAADVAPRTFFRYFPTKEDVVFLDQDVEDAVVARAIANRRPGEDDVALLVRAVVEAMTATQANFRFTGALLPLVLKTPNLIARTFDVMLRAERGLVEALTPKRASRQERLRVIALSSAFIGAVRAVIVEWVEGGMRGDPGPLVAEVGHWLARGFNR